MSRSAIALVIVVVAAAVGACQPSGSQSSTGQPPTGAPSGSAPTSVVPLTVGLGYIPSVQFAPFYYAQQQGLYGACGLQVAFQNQIDPNLITLVGQGSIDVGLADGTSVVPAVSQGIPIKYLATVYGTFPSIVFAKASSGITTAADLKGKRIGIPGRYGSSWVMLQALLGSANLTPNDVKITEYPDFGQGAALQQGQVDAATGFDNNEPVQARLAGTDVTVLRIDSVIHLPGPGLISGTSTLSAKGGAINAFAAATLQAMRDIATDPTKGLDASIAAVPDLGKDRTTQDAILRATIADWSTPGDGPSAYGLIDQAGWQATIDYLGTLGMTPKPVTVDDATATFAKGVPSSPCGG
ncbi:MAG TPA: ABC transporter substrate-binding protein [Candidatus Limnocylindrales bacterium]|nr:ABC transporter substrate-binding protein [Candidatus Limnocylindrales bacterium]